MYLSSFALGIVSLCLQPGGQILEKRRLLRMVAKLSKVGPGNSVGHFRLISVPD